MSSRPVSDFVSRKVRPPSKGERVMGALFPNRGVGWPGGWSQDRLEQVLHLRNWTYVAITSIARKIGQIVPNIAMAHKRSVPGRTQKYYLSDVGRYGGTTHTSDFGISAGAYYHKALSVVKPHEELEPVDDDHLLKRLIEHPNPMDTSFDLLYELTMFMELCGVAYLWAVPNGAGVPSELWVIPSHWVWPRTGGSRYVTPSNPYAEQLIQYYEIRPWGGMGSSGILRFPPDEVIMFPWKSPINKIDGYSTLSATSQWIDTEESISKSRWSQFINQARPEFWVELGPEYEDPTEDQIERVAAKFMTKYQGEYNFGKPIFTPPGAKVTPLSFNPTEMSYYQCLDAETECLTADGWKKYKELTTDTLIACFNSDGDHLEYHKPSKVYIDRYTGPMHRWQGVNLDLLVTPDHRMWVKGQQPENSPWRVRRVSELADTMQYCLRVASPVESSDPDFVDIHKYKKWTKNDCLVENVKIDAKSWASFLGWYVSEGHASKERSSLGISQSIDSEHTEGLDKLLSGLPYTWVKCICGGTDNKGCYQWRTHDRGLYEHVVEHCGKTAREKRLPRYVMGWSANLLKHLLFAAISGDGKGPVVDKYGHQSWYYRTTSSRLAEDMQEVGVKCGYRSNIGVSHYYHKGERCNYYTVHLSDRDHRWVYGRNRDVVDYRGDIWCVTVPTGFFVVRRNGCVHITGNSEEQIRDMILSAFSVPKSVVGISNDMTFGSLLAATANFCTFCINPRLAMIGLRLTKFLAPFFAEGDEHPRIWWDDCSPADPAQLNSDITTDASQLAITPNEIRVLRGRKPYENGGDDPMGNGPGGQVPIPLNTGDDLTGLADLIPALGQGEGEPEAGAGFGEEQQVDAENADTPSLPDMNPTIEEPNGPPSKEHFKAEMQKWDLWFDTVSMTEEWEGVKQACCGDVGKALGFAKIMELDRIDRVTKDKRLKGDVRKKAGPFQFASTQFNIDQCGYSRSQGSPLDELVRMAKSIPDEDLAEDGREDKFHVTVKYGLHTDDAEEVRKAVQGFGGVLLTLGKTSVFPASEGKDYDVVKVEVDSRELRYLNRLISESLEHTDTFPDYNPHITLAYVKPGLGEKYAGMPDVDGMQVHASRLAYCDKQGQQTVIELVDRDPLPSEKSKAGKGDCRWVTVGGEGGEGGGGTPMCIDGSGTVQAGPQHLEGKPVNNLPSSSGGDKKPEEPASPTSNLPGNKPVSSATPAGQTSSQTTQQDGGKKKKPWDANWSAQTNTSGSGNGTLTDKNGKTYEIQHEVKTGPDGDAKHIYTIVEPGAARGVTVGQAETGWNKNRIMGLNVQPEFRRRGIASALYRHIEQHLGSKLYENEATTPDGEAFWRARQQQGEGEAFRDAQGNEIERSLQKGSGSCKPGERSDLTGCTPADGGGGKTNPDVQNDDSREGGSSAVGGRKDSLIDWIAGKLGFQTLEEKIEALMGASTPPPSTLSPEQSGRLLESFSQNSALHEIAKKVADITQEGELQKIDTQMETMRQEHTSRHKKLLDLQYPSRLPKTKRERDALAKKAEQAKREFEQWEDENTKLRDDLIGKKVRIDEHVRNLAMEALSIPDGSAPSVEGDVPEKLAEKFDTASGFFSRVLKGGDSLPKFSCKELTGEDQRAYYNSESGSVHLPSWANDKTAIHEIGHHLERTMPGVRSAVQAFQDRRCGDSEYVKMNDLVPSAGYSSYEVTREDKFGPALGEVGGYYAGKRYPDGDTEILSMGVEKLYEDPVGFAQADPEYFAFVLGILRGDVRAEQ